MKFKTLKFTIPHDDSGDDTRDLNIKDLKKVRRNGYDI